MNIEVVIAQEIKRVSDLLVKASARGDKVETRRLGALLLHLEKELESARKTTTIESPVSLPKYLKPALPSPGIKLNVTTDPTVVEEIVEAGKKFQQELQKVQQAVQAGFNAASRQIGKSAAVRQSLEDQLRSMNLGAPVFSSMTVSNGVKMYEKRYIDTETGDVITTVENASGGIMQMSRHPGGVLSGIPTKKRSAPSPIDFKITLAGNRLRCSGEVLKDGSDRCGKWSCAHRAEWMGRTESVGAFGQFVYNSQPGDTCTRIVMLPICNGLLVVEVAIRINRVGEPDSEGWVEFLAEHALLRGDIVVSLPLSPSRGDTLNHVVRAIEDFYRMQPEHDDVVFNQALKCSNSMMHLPGFERDAVALLLDEANLSVHAPMSEAFEILGVANSYSRINSLSADDSTGIGLCVLCYKRRWELT